MESFLDRANPIAIESNWTDEIKYLNSANDNISDEIMKIPKNTGGIYMFYIKGICLPFSERYIVYIGRCQYTDDQNINKRAKEYFKDTRPQIKKMFKFWKEYLYYRYYPDTDNNRIKSNEEMLIRAIKPEFNEDIPDKIEIQPTIKAF